MRVIPSNVFLVVIHDVAPPLLSSVRAILAQVHPLVQTNVAAAVVPRWHGTQLSRAHRGFIELVQTNCREILLHGYTHHRVGHGLISALTGGADEFVSLSAVEAIERLRRAQAVLTEVFGEAAVGFVPPTWHRGPLTDHLLAEAGLRYCIGLTRITCSPRAPIPLATWSWDLGVIAFSGYLGELAGTILFTCRRSAIPCVVFHPVDQRRGFVERGIRWIQTLLDQGRQPVVFKDLF
jgi:predicted deacetylase